MRALRILVVVMGVMLVGGFIALIVSIAYMTKHKQSVATGRDNDRGDDPLYRGAD